MTIHVPMLIEIAGLLAVFVVLLMLVVTAVSSIRRAALASHRRRAELDLLRERVESLRRQRLVASDSTAAWNGYRKFEVQKRADECGDICSFYLIPHDRKSLPRFRPGQYLTFQLGIPGQAKPVVRCYSLSEAPGREYYRVTIKRLAAPRDKPEALPGLSSNFFHQHVQVGDILNVKAPGGHFFLDLADNAPVVLIGGGVGLTPVLSMLNAIVEGGSNRQTWFFYGVRNRQEHIMADHLRRIALEHANVRLHVCYSNPDPDAVKERDYHHAERVSVELFKRLLPSSNFRFYICGPPAMMESLVHGLEAWGVPKEHIHFEAFGPATVKRAAPVQPAASGAGAETAIEVQFVRSGKKCGWTAAAGSLLELAEANGIVIDSGCRAGNCGTCLTAIRSGSVTYAQQPGYKPEEGSCLTCLAVPKEPLILDA
jgi:ferredoxin-NADP reductase